MIHASRKSAGSQGQPKREDLVLIGHPFECESQESSVMGGYLDVKVRIFAYLRKDLFQSDHPEQTFYQVAIRESEI